MRTTSLDGKSGSAWLKLAKRGRLRLMWEIRLIDFQGNKISAAGWKIYTIPRGAMLHRVRTRDLEEGTDELDLEIAVDALPSGVTIEQYDGIEIDLVFQSGGRWAYFYGEIDHAPESWQDRDGVPVLGQMIKAWGILQRCKGVRLNSIVSAADVVATNEQLMGICSTIKAQVTTAIRPNSNTTAGVAPLDTNISVTAGHASSTLHPSGTGRFVVGQPILLRNGSDTALVRVTGLDNVNHKISCTPVPGTVVFPINAAILQAEDLPVSTITYGLTETIAGTPGLTISGNTDFSSPKVLNTDFLVDTSAGAPVLAWINVPPSTRYMRFFKVDRFVAPRVSLYVNVTAGGSGYTSAPTVTIAAPAQAGGQQALATAVVSGGQVVAVVVTRQGTGYTSAPAVSFSGGGGSGATATSAIRTAFHVLPNTGNYDTSLGPLNYGRDFTDLYHTTAAGVSGNVITPADLAPFTVSGNFLNLSQAEYVIIEPSGGTFAGQAIARKITSINSGTGAITVDHLPAGFAVGDKFHVATTEHWQAWDDTQELHFYPTSSIGTNELPRRWWNPLPGVGQVYQTEAKNWTTSDAVFCQNVALIKDPTDWTGLYYGAASNRVENRLHAWLTDSSASGLALYAAGADVTSGQFRTQRSGAVMRNYSRFGIDLPQLLEDVLKMLPSNVKLKDHPGDGSATMAKHGFITLYPVSQKATPDYSLIDVKGPDINPAPERYTATLTIAEGDPVNLAPGIVSVVENCRNPAALVDNSRDTDCYALDPAASMGVQVRIPRITPREIFPYLDKLVITGRGLLTVCVFDGSTRYLISPYDQKPIGRPAGVVGPFALTATAGPTATQLTLASVEGITPGMVLTLIERSGGTTPGTKTTVLVREVNPAAKVVDLRDAVGGAYTYTTNATAEGLRVASETVELDQDALTRGMGWVSYTTKPTDIIIQLDYNKDITGPAASEVEAPTKIHGAWLSKFTSLTSESPADAGAAEYGTVHQQWDIKQRVSARYVPPEILRKLVPKWDTSAAGNHRHRIQTRRAPGISIQAARDIAERDQDETLRLGVEYSVTALLDPRSEVGDTVFYTDPDGGEYIQLLTRTRDAGGPEDLDMEYFMHDYGLIA